MKVIEEKNQALSLKDLAVNGEDLAKIGIPKSKEMGEILSKLLEMVIDYPTLNQKDTLLDQARRIRSASSSQEQA